MAKVEKGITNNLISALPNSVYQDILSRCDTVELTFGDILYEAEQPFQFVYFPTSGFISLLTTLDGCEPLEMGLIGDEGMFGASLVFNIDITTMQTVVQGSGKALSLAVPQFRELLHKHPVLNGRLSRYQFVLMEQLVQSAACTYFHAIDARLARWLLMSHDRAHTDTLQLTHMFLARMLGVRRSGVTIAAGQLQEKALIDYRRGHIHVLNRKGLEAESCQCYKKMLNIYSRYLQDCNIREPDGPL